MSQKDSYLLLDNCYVSCRKKLMLARWFLALQGHDDDLDNVSAKSETISGEEKVKPDAHDEADVPDPVKGRKGKPKAKGKKHVRTNGIILNIFSRCCD